jgi:hypothetical protein
VLAYISLFGAIWTFLRLCLMKKRRSPPYLITMMLCITILTTSVAIIARPAVDCPKCPEWKKEMQVVATVRQTMLRNNITN